MTLDKFLDDIDEADLRQLIENKVSGCRAVEYKECLPDDTFESQKEFLAEVSSFANTSGGHLIYGVKEQNGIPVALPGLPGKDPDREIPRLEKLLRDYLQPRCQGIMIRAIDLTSAPPAIVMHIPESWSKPHVVNFQGHWRFYARNSAGKYPLGITELKSAFLTTMGLGEQIRSFRFERLNKISSDDLPVPLLGKARTVLHLIPYSAFESKSSIVFTGIEDIWSIPLMYTGTSGYRFNLDGLIVYNEKEEGCASEGYTQVFRNGIIESVTPGLFGSNEDPYTPSATFERDTTAFLNACLSFYQKLSIRTPAVFFMSLAGVRDCELAVHRNLETWHNNVNRIDRDSLLLPEVIVDRLAGNPATLLKPVFNAVWNSTGWEGLYYEETRSKALVFPNEKFASKRLNASNGLV